MKVAEWAEEIVAQDPGHTHWRRSGQELRDLLEKWKDLQRKGPHLGRSIKDKLWKRFSAAYTQFNCHRRQYFSTPDQTQSEAKRIKEVLAAEAEVLQISADWGATSRICRELMNCWGAAPCASREENDAL